MLYHLLVIIIIYRYPDLRGSQKYRRLPPSDRHGPSREGHRAPADVVIENCEHDYDDEPEYVDGDVDDDDRDEGEHLH